MTKKMECRSRFCIANRFQRKILTLVFFSTVVPMGVAVICIYYLIFNIMASEIGIPEAIGYALIPAARRTAFVAVIGFLISVCLLWMWAQVVSHRMAGPLERFPKRLIPTAIKSAIGLTKRKVPIFGQGFRTEDGTCIRDYVHVTDLCNAHLLALESLLSGLSGNYVYNLGSDKGASVQEVIDVARKVTGKKIPTIYKPSRAGDPSCLIADSSLIRKELGWKPQYSDLETMIKHEWEWEKKQ